MQSRPTERPAPTDMRSTDRMSFEEFVRAISPLLVPALPLYGSAFTLLVLGAHWVVPGRFGAVATIVSSFVLLVAPASALAAAIARPAIGTALFAVGLDPFTAVLVALATAELLAVVLGVWRSRARPPGDRATASGRFSLGGSFHGIVVATP